MNVLVVKSGSSSLKFQVISTDLERISTLIQQLHNRGVAPRLAELVPTAGGMTPCAVGRELSLAALVQDSFRHDRAGWRWGWRFSFSLFDTK